MYIIDELDLINLLNRTIENLSEGELQRFAICQIYYQIINVYMFYVPASYLDVKLRLRAADAIFDLANFQNYTIVVEHDLSVLDYLSDSMCVLYGVHSIYGVVSLLYGVIEGINVFLDGFIQTENMRFRDFERNFKVGNVKVDRS